MTTLLSSRLILPVMVFTILGLLAVLLAVGSPPAQAQSSTPAVPNLTVTPVTGGTKLDVSWQAPTGVTVDSYTIIWKTPSQTYFVPTGSISITAPATSYQITDLTANTTYDVQVRAVNPPATIVAQSETSATTSPPAVPNLTVTADPRSTTTLDVSWGAVVSATSYSIQWKTGSQSYSVSERFLNESSGTTSVEISGPAGNANALLPNTTYDVRVTARSGATVLAQSETSATTNATAVVYMPTVLQAPDHAAVEGTTMRFPLQLYDMTTGEFVGAPPGGLTLNLTVSDATNGGDFIATANEGAKTVTFAEGESRITYRVLTVDDNQDEPGGNIKLTIVAGTGYTLSTNANLATHDSYVNDNDEVAGLELRLVDSDLALGTKYRSIDESGGEQALTARVTLLGTDGNPVRAAADTSVSMSFVTTTGGVDTVAADFTVAPAAGTVTVSASQSFAEWMFQITPNHDTVQEDPERFELKASVTSNTAFADTVDLYLVDAGWQGPELTLTVSPATIDESAGPTTITLTATVTGAVTLVRDVHLNVEHGEYYGFIYSCPRSFQRYFFTNWRYYDDDCPPLAIGPNDYRGDDNWKGPRDYRIGRFNPLGPVVVTLPAGQTSASASYVFVPLDDKIDEPYEVVYFIPFDSHLGPGGNYPAAEFRITNHDPPAWPPVTPVPTPVLPGLTVSPVDGEPTKLAVSWDPVEDAATYHVRWKTGSDDYGDAVETAETGYTITGLTEGADYTVNVTAVDRYNIIRAEATDPWVWVVTVTAVEGSTDAVDVSWGPVGGALHYFISMDGASPVQSDAPRTTRRFTGLEPDTEYTFTVEAVSAMSDGFETLEKVEVKGRTNAPPPANNPASGAPTISGTAKVGETLTADASGISDADGLDNVTFSYQWLADGSDISGATGSTYTLVAGDVGKAISVKVSFTDDAGNAETLTSTATAAVVAANTSASGAPTISGTVQVGETLTASTSGITDADGLDNVTFAYQWLADGSAISGATGSTYTPASGDVGKAITVRVSFTDDAGNAETLTSAATAEVAAAATEEQPPANSAASGAPTISGTAQVGQTLTASTSGITDADGLTSASFTYQWLADGSDISGATGSTYTPVSGDVGKAISVRVSFTDDADNDESLTSSATSAVVAANTAASGAPSISGTAQVGQTLTVDTSGITDADGLDNASFTYQWLADGSAISGATGSTYTPVSGDVGKAISVRVSFTDDAGNAETLTSTATSAVAAAATEEQPPANSAATGAPTISGTAQVGQTLTASTSGITDADGLTNATFSYQWLADGSDISGATGSTYTPVSGDVDKAISVRVSFTDDADNDESLTSSATSAVVAANTPASGAPTISGTVQVGEVLTASTSGITDADGLDNATFTYQWLADGSAISGATGSTYTPVSGDLTKAITVRVSFTDDAGNAETLTSAAATAFVIYYDPNAGDAAVDRYNQGVKALKDAGISYSEVTGDVQDDVDRLAGVTGSVLPRFFLGDPTAEGWTSQTKVNNGGLRWLKKKVAELSGD